jgi:hypothetical protein
MKHWTSFDVKVCHPQKKDAVSYEPDRYPSPPKFRKPGIEYTPGCSYKNDPKD